MSNYKEYIERCLWALAIAAALATPSDTGISSKPIRNRNSITREGSQKFSSFAEAQSIKGDNLYII